MKRIYYQITSYSRDGEFDSNQLVRITQADKPAPKRSASFKRKELP